MADDPNAHDPTLGDADWGDADEDIDESALYGDPDDDAPAQEAPAAQTLGTTNYREYVERAKQADSLDALFQQASDRIRKPPTPVTGDESDELDAAVESAVTDAANDRSGGCAFCGSENLEEDDGRLVCRSCGAHSPVGPQVWVVLTRDGERHACCSDLCARVAARRFDADAPAHATTWPDDDPGDCYACGVDIKETLMPDGGSQ